MPTTPPRDNRGRFRKQDIPGKLADEQRRMVLTSRYRNAISSSLEMMANGDAPEAVVENLEEGRQSLLRVGWKGDVL